MATIQYRCNTCEREIAITENIRGLTVFGKCVITEGCKGRLYKLSRNPNTIREDLDFPPVVPGLSDYTPRRTFYQETINISTDSWQLTHDLGVSPAVTIYFFDDNTGQPIEVSPDEYTVQIINENRIEVSFGIRRRGIVHLVARSSVPRNVVTVPNEQELFQVSHLGYLDFAVTSIINTTGGVRFLTEDDFDLDIEVIVPSTPAINVQGTYLFDTLPNSSPWFGWGQVLLRKRRNFATKSLQVLDIISDAFPSAITLSDIPDGTRFEIQQVRYRNVDDMYLGDFIDIGPRQLMLLLANSPYGVVDKIRDRTVDIGELSLASANRFFVFGGEVFLDESNIERMYPRIERASTTNLLSTPTPTPTLTVTPTPTVP